MKKITNDNLIKPELTTLKQSYTEKVKDFEKIAETHHEDIYELLNNYLLNSGILKFKIGEYVRHAGREENFIYKGWKMKFSSCWEDLRKAKNFKEPQEYMHFVFDEIDNAGKYANCTLSVFFTNLCEFEIIIPGSKDADLESGFVYLINIEDTNHYKIGIAKDVKARLSSLQTSSPFKLVLVQHRKYIKPRIIEKEIHYLFDKFRTNGEWFQFTENQINKILEQYF